MSLSVSLKGTRSTLKSDSIAMIPARNSSSDTNNVMGVERDAPRRINSLTIEQSDGFLGVVLTRKNTM